MIPYSSGKWGLLFSLTCKGSVIPKATLWSFTSCVLSGAIHIVHRSREEGTTIPTGLQFFTTYLFFAEAFLLVFRTQIAYNRYWEGITKLHGLRGTWFNAYSSLFAFVTRDKQKAHAVAEFKDYVAKLFSILHCCAMKKIAVQENESYPILGSEGIDPHMIEYLQSCHDSTEIVLQWIQQLIIDSHTSGVLPVPPPILSRVFQELSNGIVDVNFVCTITEIPFPFPYSQVLTVLLTVSTLALSFMSGLYAENLLISLIGGFTMPFTFWCINYIAQELEMPFGDDPNDLPIDELQENFNLGLIQLLDVEASKPPKFNSTVQHSTPCSRSRLTIVPQKSPEHRDGSALKPEVAVEEYVSYCNSFATTEARHGSMVIGASADGDDATFDDNNSRQACISHPGSMKAPADACPGSAKAPADACKARDKFADANNDASVNDAHRKPKESFSNELVGHNYSPSHKLEDFASASGNRIGLKL